MYQNQMKRLVCSLKLCNLLFLETFCMEKMSFFFLHCYQCCFWSQVHLHFFRLLTLLERKVCVCAESVREIPICFVSLQLSHLSPMGTLITNWVSSFLSTRCSCEFCKNVRLLKGKKKLYSANAAMCIKCLTCEWDPRLHDVMRGWKMWMKVGFSSFSLWTYRPIELSFLIHTEVESSVHPSDADQTHRQTDELQDAWDQTTHTRGDAEGII